MALDSLATTADLDARTIAWSDQVLAETYLGVASAAVRDAARCPISAVTSTLTLYADGHSQYLRLPGIPVTAVTDVILDGTHLVQGTDYALMDGSLFRPTGWRASVLPGSFPDRGYGLDCDLALPKPVTATVTHGLTPVPEDIVDLVCRMTASALVAASASDDGAGLATGNVVSERLGDYYVQYSPDSGVTEMELSPRTFARIRSRFGSGTGMVQSR